jgi:hypothetical protein
MTNQQTCPHCGADYVKRYDEFICGTRPADVFLNDVCYERQLAAQAAEIERLKERNKILEETVRIACEEYPVEVK